MMKKVISNNFVSYTASGIKIKKMKKNMMTKRKHLKFNYLRNLFETIPCVIVLTTEEKNLMNLTK